MVQLWRQIKPFFTPQKTLVVFMIVLYDNVQKKEGRKEERFDKKIFIEDKKDYKTVAFV